MTTKNNDILPESKEKKIDFIQAKNNAVNSLFEVEHFLCNLNKIINTIKFYKLFK